MRSLRWLVGVCLMVLLSFCGGIGAKAELKETDPEKFKYCDAWWEGDGAISITKYIGEDESVVIPSKIDGKTVTEIGSEAFAGCKVIKSCVIPEGVVKVRYRAFKWCVNLESVVLPEGVGVLEGEAFMGCRGLEAIALPSTIQAIGESGFAHTGLRGISLPDSIVSLEYGTFYKCEQLENVVLPKRLSAIGDSVFMGCDSLLQIRVPGSVKVMGMDCLANCDRLQEVYIGEGVEEIGRAAFWNSVLLKKVTIPDSVKQIGENAFEEFFRGNLPDVVLYANPGSYASAYAASNNIKYSCICHTAIVKDAAVAPTCGDPGKTEGSHCSDCGMVVAAQKAVSPTGRHSWDSGRVTSAASYIIQGIRTFTCIVCKAEKTESIPYISNVTNVPNILNQTYITFRLVRSPSGVKEAEVVRIKRSKSFVNIPNSIVVKGIVYKVTSIGKNVCKGNRKLTKITLGVNVAKIGAKAFYGCRGLRIIVVKSKRLGSVGKGALKGINPRAEIKVPAEKKKDYRKLFKNKGQSRGVKVM